MKVTKFIEVTAEVEVDVDIHDVIDGLRARYDTHETAQAVLCGVSNALTFLKSIPADVIGAMKPAARKIIFTELRTQSARYDDAPLQETDVLSSPPVCTDLQECAE